VVGAEGFIKGHIHTEEPEKLLAMVAQHGKMVRSKIEDMSEQHSEILADVNHKEIQAPQSAMVAVSAGYGITKVFRSLGARVVGGGQTNNPSVQDIADAVHSLEASEIVIMPNNKNIILAAERVAELIPDKTIKVLPTRSLGQGLAAALVFQADAPLDSNYASMEAASQQALTLEVTTASRDANIEGVEVSEGDYIGLVNGSLRVSEKTAVAALKALLSEVSEDYEIGTLFHNTSLDKAQAQALVENLEASFPELEVEVLAGSPDLYEFVMALE
jgi:dihydroxyacetone kinase-like predicted kinase